MGGSSGGGTSTWGAKASDWTKKVTGNSPKDNNPNFAGFTKDGDGNIVSTPSGAGPGGIVGDFGNAFPAPKFTSILNKGGGLKSPYKMNTNMKPWMGLQNEALTQQGQNMSGQAARDANVTAGNAFSNLAATGGADAGSRERLAMATGINKTNTLSDISRQINGGRTDIAIAGEGMTRDAQGKNVQNAILGVGGKNVFDMAKYGEKAKLYAADKTGQAIGGGGGGKK